MPFPVVAVAPIFEMEMRKFLDRKLKGLDDLVHYWKDDRFDMIEGFIIQFNWSAKLQPRLGIHRRRLSEDLRYDRDGFPACLGNDDGLCFPYGQIIIFFVCHDRNVSLRFSDRE